MRSIYHIAFFTVIIFCASLTAVQSKAQLKVTRKMIQKERIQRTLLGVKLRPRVGALLAEVEKLYGKKVQAEFANISESPEGDDTAGRAMISDDGTPMVKIDSHIGPGDGARVERIMAHELLHLRLRATGYPTLFFHGETGLMTSFGPYLLAAGNTLCNGLEHRMFAPEMRAMGFDPGEEIKHGLEKFREAGRTGQGDDVLLALYYYRAILEYEDPKLLARLRQGYVEGDRLGIIKLSESLAQIVIKGKPHTPHDVAKTLLTCLDTLFQKLMVFTLLPPTAKVSGAVSLQRVNLQVTRGQ